MGQLPDKNNRPVLTLGLTDQDIALLREGLPITANTLHLLGLPAITLVIAHGTDQAAARQAMVDAIRPGDELIDLPPLPAAREA